MPTKTVGTYAPPAGLRPFSTARDDPLHGRDADRKIGGPRYLLF